MDYYLGDIIRETGKVAAVGCALNVKLNQKIISRPEVKELFVQPAASDAGHRGRRGGLRVAPARRAGGEDGARLPRPGVFQRGRHRRLRLSRGQAAAAEDRQPQPAYRQDPLADGNPAAWFQDAWSSSACPVAAPFSAARACRAWPTGSTAQIVFSERWRPFRHDAGYRRPADVLVIDHPAPSMTFTFEVNEEWKERVPEVVHEDGTSRAQVLKREHNPRYYDLMKELENLTGNGVALNTSLNRRGRTDDLLADRRPEHVLRLRSAVPDHGGHPGREGGRGLV